MHDRIFNHGIRTDGAVASDSDPSLENGARQDHGSGADADVGADDDAVGTGERNALGDHLIQNGRARDAIQLVELHRVVRAHDDAGVVGGERVRRVAQELDGVGKIIFARDGALGDMIGVQHREQRVHIEPVGAGVDLFDRQLLHRGFLVLHDRHQAFVRRAENSSVAGRVGEHGGDDRHAVALRLVEIKGIGDVAAVHEGRVAVENQHVSAPVGFKEGFCHHDGVTCALALGLRHGGTGFVAGVGLGKILLYHLFKMPRHDADVPDPCLAHRVDDPSEHRLEENLHHRLGLFGLHALALSCRQYDGTDAPGTYRLGKAPGILIGNRKHVYMQLLKSFTFCLTCFSANTKR